MRTMTPSIARREEIGFLQSSGQRVRYRVRGDGPPLLMMHGIGAPFELWGSFESRLSGFRTITVDAPGSGHSSTPEGRFRMRDYAEVMADLLTHLRIESAHVLGISLGGMMAQEFARRSPERVEKLVLVSTSCGVLASPISMAFLRAPARSYTNRRPARGADDEFSLLRLHWELRDAYTPSIRGLARQVQAAWTWTSRPWLKELEMPVLVIAGSDDAMVPLAHSRIIASGVQNGRLEIIPEGGHLCLLKKATYSSQLIRAFLAGEQ